MGNSTTFPRVSLSLAAAVKCRYRAESLKNGRKIKQGTKAVNKGQRADAGGGARTRAYWRTGRFPPRSAQAFCIFPPSRCIVVSMDQRQASLARHVDLSRTTRIHDAAQTYPSACAR